MYKEAEVLLKIEGLNKNYDVPILRDINLEIKNIQIENKTQGQIVSLVGKSGSGKSTLFRILAGLEKPTSGKVTIWRPDGSYAPVKEGNMGVVFQTSYVYPWRRVKSILTMAADKNPFKVEKDYITQLAEQLDITKLLDKYPSQISGGQRQRVAIGEQILNGGDFILLDEPFSGLDTLTIDKVTKIITDLAATDDHKTFIIVSHDLSNSLAISDTAFILAKEEGKDGATIAHKINLAEQGLAWRTDIKEDMVFRNLLNQIKTLL